MIPCSCRALQIGLVDQFYPLASRPTVIIVSVSLSTLVRMCLTTIVIENLPGGGSQRVWLPDGWTKCGENPNDMYEAYTTDYLRSIIICRYTFDDRDET